jgi:hypothetical protein
VNGSENVLKTNAEKGSLSDILRSTSAFWASLPVTAPRAHGVELMVGNMMGTSLAMAPGYVVAQLCRFVDLDGALFLTRDREHPMTYSGGYLSRPSADLWG